MSVDQSLGKMLSLVLLSSFWVQSWSMTLCEYYEARGIFKPECQNHELAHLNSFEFNNQIQQPEFGFPNSFESNPHLTFSSFKSVETTKFPEHQLCTGFFHSCFDSNQCESGTICSQMFSTRRCCTAPESQCPSPTKLGINCRKFNPTNWCNFDEDCHSRRSSRMICCPSGCNYNICVAPKNQLMASSLVHSNLYSMTKSLSPDCPDPLSISMKCEKHRPTDWCHRHSDCPSSPNALNPRRCCFTPCGYRACFIKFGGIWVIG